VADLGWLTVLFLVGAIAELVVKALRRRGEGVSVPTTVEPVPTRRVWFPASGEPRRIGRRADRAFEPGEDVEDEGESLETVPETVSLETDVRRAERVVVDLDDESRLAAARRLKDALARNRPHGREDHRRFDAKIRAPEPTAPAGPSARPPTTRERMREAVKWREILDRPVGWRDEP
jgi:hypothetical protein